VADSAEGAAGTPAAGDLAGSAGAAAEAAGRLEVGSAGRGLLNSARVG
jgi:hypothetical protein